MSSASAAARRGVASPPAGAATARSSPALAREAEVDDADLAVVRDHDVVGLEVAVDEPGGVRGGEAAARRQEDLAAISRQRALPRPAASRRRVSPSTNSMAMKTLSPKVPTS